MATRKIGIRIVLVVEDRRLERFCRESLLLLGYHRRKIRVPPLPGARGSGKQWVDKKFVVEVKVLRRKKEPRLAVRVGSDVDNLSRSERVGNLERALESVGMSNRGADERIAYWLPKWSIETWIKCLQGKKVDEETKYKRHVKKVDFRQVAKTFVEQYRKADPLGLSTLEYAFTETPKAEGRGVNGRFVVKEQMQRVLPCVLRPDT